MPSDLTKHIAYVNNLLRQEMGQIVGAPRFQWVFSKPGVYPGPSLMLTYKADSDDANAYNLVESPNGIVYGAQFRKMQSDIITKVMTNLAPDGQWLMAVFVPPETEDEKDTIPEGFWFPLVLPTGPITVPAGQFPTIEFTLGFCGAYRRAEEDRKAHKARIEAARDTLEWSRVDPKTGRMDLFAKAPAGSKAARGEEILGDLMPAFNGNGRATILNPATPTSFGKGTRTSDTIDIAS